MSKSLEPQTLWPNLPVSLNRSWRLWEFSIFDSPESLLEKDAEKFIKEEDEPTEPIDISEFETPHRPPIESKPLPAGLRYTFLHGDTESPVIISDKLSEEESARLITPEKHRASSCSGILPP